MGRDPGLGLRALLCCVFEKEEGPIVLCSDPANALAVGKQFKPLGRYLLPETFVKGRVVSIVLDDNVVLGAPVYIEDTLYDRNCFQFNICMVIGSRIDAEPHRDLAQHLAMSFHALEVETKLLSRPEEVSHVQSILASLRSQLNTSEDCFVRVTDSHCIAFRVRRWSPALAPPPFLSQVPVPLVDLARCLEPPSGAGAGQQEVGEQSPDRGAALQLPRRARRPSMPFEPDLTLLQLAPFLDGMRSVQDIVEASALGEERVLLCLQHLLHFGLVAVIDAIELESRYSLTPGFHTAFEQLDISTDAVPYVTAGRMKGDGELLGVVQGLYAEMNGWDQTLGEFQQERVEELREHRISLRHFVTFGLLKGFLERIDKALTQEESRELQTLRTTTIRRKQELREQGKNNVQVNKEPEIKALVTRMNSLKAKEWKGRPSIDGARSSEG